MDWGTGDLAVRDLVAGQNRRVTNKGGYIKAEAEAEANAISPDGRLIAFAWNRWDKQAALRQAISFGLSAPMAAMNASS